MQICLLSYVTGGSGAPPLLFLVYIDRHQSTEKKSVGIGYTDHTGLGTLVPGGSCCIWP